MDARRKVVVLVMVALPLVAGACGSSKKMTPSGPTPGTEPSGTRSGEAGSDPSPARETDASRLLLNTIYFDYDRHELRADARETLTGNGKQLVENSGAKVTIEGHCDERGTVEYNLALGERRAQAARSYLVAYGVDPGRIGTISYGEERPSDAGSGESAWSRNRRAEFRLRP